MEHQFNVNFAKKYGIEEAILIHNMYFWINKNAVNNKHLYNGHYWTYNTQKALSDLFPYIHETKIQRSLKHLYECGFIIKGNFNKTKLDRTCWYAFSDEALSILRNEGYDISKMKNAKLQNEVTIPYSKHTDSNTDEKEDTKVSKKGGGVILKEIVDYWNEHCQSYASVNILTEKRKIAINKLMQNNHANIDDVKKAMDILESADSFWKGDNDKSWKASFDWFIKDTNGCFARILEGEMTKNINLFSKVENNNPQTSKYR